MAFSSMHVFPTLAAPDPISEQAKAVNWQEQELLKTYREWQAKGKDASAARQAFATNCRCLWHQHKAQGSRTGKLGFKRVLRRLGINERAAYKAMWEAFPSERPTSRRVAAKSLPLPRLDLKKLKSLSSNADDFQLELSFGLQAIANAVAERYGLDVLFTATLTRDAKS